MRRNCPGWSRRGWSIWCARHFTRDASAISTPSDRVRSGRPIRQPELLWFRIAIRASSMSTASWWPPARGRGWRSDFIRSVRAGGVPDTSVFSAKSIYPAKSGSRTRSTRRWDLSRSAPRASTAAPERCAICRARCPIVQSMIRKWSRFSLATNARRLHRDHAQTDRGLRLQFDDAVRFVKVSVVLAYAALAGGSASTE